jgi:hypothetical protein
MYQEHISGHVLDCPPSVVTSSVPHGAPPGPTSGASSPPIRVNHFIVASTLRTPAAISFSEAVISFRTSRSSGGHRRWSRHQAVGTWIIVLWLGWSTKRGSTLVREGGGVRRRPTPLFCLLDELDLICSSEWRDATPEVNRRRRVPVRILLALHFLDPAPRNYRRR